MTSHTTTADLVERVRAIGERRSKLAAELDAVDDELYGALVAARESSPPATWAALNAVAALGRSEAATQMWLSRQAHARTPEPNATDHEAERGKFVTLAELAARYGVTVKTILNRIENLPDSDVAREVEVVPPARGKKHRRYRLR